MRPHPPQQDHTHSNKAIPTPTKPSLLIVLLLGGSIFKPPQHVMDWKPWVLAECTHKPGFEYSYTSPFPKYVPVLSSALPSVILNNCHINFSKAEVAKHSYKGPDMVQQPATPWVSTLSNFTISGDSSCGQQGKWLERAVCYLYSVHVWIWSTESFTDSS